MACRRQRRSEVRQLGALLSALIALLAVRASAQPGASGTPVHPQAALDTVEEEAVFDEEPASPARGSVGTEAATVEEEAVFGDEPGDLASTAPVAGSAVEEEAVFAAGDDDGQVGPNAGFPEHDTRPWLLILPALGLALLAGQVRWRGPVEEKR